MNKLFVSFFLRFLADYDEQFPIADDVSLLQQAFPHLYPLLRQWKLKIFTGLKISVFYDFVLFSLILRIRDETRTSYLLQGVESAWESVGKKRSFPSAFSSANHSTGARSKSGRDTDASMKEGAGFAGVREKLRGAEAMTDTPSKGDNVSFYFCSC